MQIRISGKHMDVGDSMRTHIETRLEAGVNKYLDRVTDANVVIHKETNQFAVDIHINTGTHAHLVVKASAKGTDAYGTFDAAADRVEKQLRRYKRKLKNHKARANKEDVAEMSYYVLSAHEEEVPEEGNPLVIAEENKRVEELSVSEAVMRLDLEDLPALIFINAAHGRLNVVYRRHDGNVGWMDSPEASSKPLLKKVG